MRTIRCGVSLPFVALLAYSQVSLAADEARTWRIEGRVVDSQSRPVAEAIVFIPARAAKESTVTETTDADGHFQLDAPYPPNGLTLQAKVDHRAKLAYKILPWDIQHETPAANVELVLKPARQLAAEVVDDSDQPVRDATVVAVAGYMSVDRASTGADGRAKLRVPADAELQSTVAFKPGVGLDYLLVPNREPSEPVKFTLNGTQTVVVRVVDDQDRPLANQRVYPWLLSKPRKTGGLNLSGLSEFIVQTDENGVAAFELIPADVVSNIGFFVRVPGYHLPEQIEFKPASGETELVAKLLSLVSVSGKVKFADGRPAGGIDVQVAGAGHSTDRFREQTKSDTEGRFELEVNPNHYYQFAAGNREFASPPVNKIVRRQKVDEIELVLQPAKRVFGRVTVGANKSPVSGTYLQLCQQNAVGYYDLPESDQLPNPTDNNIAILPQIEWSEQTDSDGDFEFFVGPGKYHLVGPSGVEPPNIELTDQTSVEVNLHSDRPDLVPVSGRVVLKDDPERGVPDASVIGFAKKSRLRELRATSDAEGRFEAERGAGEMIVHAATSDKKLAGIVAIGPDDREVVVPVGPTASAHARLIDEETKEPLANRQVDYGIWIDFDDGTFSWRFGGSATTDEQGELTIDGLVVGQEYVLEAVTETSGDGQPRGWTGAGRVTPTSTEMAEMGDVSVKRPYRPPTNEERVAKAFADERSLDERLDARVRDAGFGYQHVLVIVGDPTNPLVQQIYDLEYDATLGDSAMHYLFLPVSTIDEQRIADAKDALAPRGIDVPAAGEAALAIIDKAGALVAQTPCGELTTDGAVAGRKLRKFLEANAPKLPDAEVVLEDALARAKREDKRVFVQHSGPRCGWCFVLSRFLDDHRDVFDREFVYVKLDSRLANGQAVIDRVRPARNGGIPWMVILDADGNPLINSHGPNGNIGYPGEPESQVHFEKMLRASPRHITDDQIELLIADLAAKNE